MPVSSVTSSSGLTLKKRLAGLSALSLALGSLVGGLAFATPAGAASNVYVSPYGSDTGNNCSSQSNPCLTLAHAYTEVSSTGTINLSGGTFHGDLDIAKNITIDGTGSTGSLNVNTTTIYGNGKPSAGTFGVEVESGHTVTVSNLVLNNATDAAVLNLGTLTLNNDVIGAATNNPPFATAGIYNAGTLTMNGGSETEVTTTTIGGALYNYMGKSTLNNVSINHATAAGAAAEGGAIFVFEGTLKLTGSTAIHNNAATVDGGGIEYCHSTATLDIVGAGVSITANTPNNVSHADPEGYC
jgi:hypothetical protein